MFDYQSPFNFEEYYTIESIKDKKGWDGYISRDGKFYPTKPNFADYWHGSYNLHQDFAEDYLTDVLKINWHSEIHKLMKEDRLKERIYGAKDYLVHVIGWVSFGYSNMTNQTYIVVPRPEYMGMQPSRKQKELSLAIYEMNKFNLQDYYYRFEGQSIELTEEEIKRIEQELEGYNDDFL